MAFSNRSIEVLEERVLKAQAVLLNQQPGINDSLSEAAVQAAKELVTAFYAKPTGLSAELLEQIDALNDLYEKTMDVMD